MWWQGHIQFYDFIAPKALVKKDLINIINYDGKYTSPPHWNNYELGVDKKEDIFICFKSGPNEIYQVDFINYDGTEFHDRTVLALVGIFDGKIWNFNRDLSWSEKRRVRQRFEKEILSKTKFYYSVR